MNIVTPIIRRDNAPPAALASLDAPELWESFMGSLSERTRALYAADFADFATWLKSAPAALAAWLMGQNQGMVNVAFLRYQSALRRKKLSAATINRRRAAVRSVLAFGRLVGATHNTLEVKSLPCQTFRDTAGPSPDRLKAMLADMELKASAGNRFAIRDLAIVRLLLLRGLRRAEAIGLDVRHYDAERSRVFVLGKQRSGREWLTIPAPAVAALEAWLAIRGRHLGPLFVSLHHHNRGGRLCLRQVNRLLEPYGIRPHGLRHSSITRALEITGGDVARVQRFSRHKNPAVLMVYDDRRRDMGGEIADMLADESMRPGPVPARPITDADLAVLTGKQRRRISALLAGRSTAQIAAADGIGLASLRETIRQAEKKIPALRDALALAGVHRSPN